MHCGLALGDYGFVCASKARVDGFASNSMIATAAREMCSIEGDSGSFD